VNIQKNRDFQWKDGNFESRKTKGTWKFQS
jgi:hypothetical protein